MKAAVLPPLLAVVILFTRTSRAEVGRPEWGAQRAQLALIDDTRVSKADRPAAGPRRFTIVLVRNEAVLLDTATGETWHLIFHDPEKRQLYWEPIPGRRGADASRPRCKKNGADQHNAAPLDEEKFDPFHEDAFDPFHEDAEGKSG